jgi:hypothetical protein
VGAFLSGIVADFARHWALYASIPVVAALIGYGTKLVAIRMMFQPVEFVGVKPFFGWQGIVPKRAARMASIACDTMTEQLIRPAEVVARLDAARIAKEIGKPLLAGVEDIVREVAGHYEPGLWEALPVRVQRLVIQRVQHEAPRMVAAVPDVIKSDVDSVFDLKGMVVTSLVKDKRLLNRIFQEAGAREFAFIARSGLVFGGAIGVVQMVAWVLFEVPPMMPVFGLFTGWLALRMIFFPIEPRRYFGVEWQGLFLKRRAEVAEAYGEPAGRRREAAAGVRGGQPQVPGGEVLDRVADHEQAAGDDALHRGLRGGRDGHPQRPGVEDEGAVPARVRAPAAPGLRAGRMDPHRHGRAAGFRGRRGPGAAAGAPGGVSPRRTEQLHPNGRTPVSTFRL